MKTSLTLSPEVLAWVDEQVDAKRFHNRSHAFDFAVQTLMDAEGAMPRSPPKPAADEPKRGTQAKIRR